MVKSASIELSIVFYEMFKLQPVDGTEYTITEERVKFPVWWNTFFFFALAHWKTLWHVVPTQKTMRTEV